MSQWIPVTRESIRHERWEQLISVRFGFWDLPQKSTIEAEFRLLGLNRAFFGIIFGSFCVSRYERARESHFKNMSNGQCMSK